MVCLPSGGRFRQTDGQQAYVFGYLVLSATARLVFDFETIISAFQRHLTEHPNLSIITTEKDAVRLVESFERFPENMREHIHYLPIEVAVLQREDALERQLRLAVKAKPKSLQNID